MAGTRVWVTWPEIPAADAAPGRDRQQDRGHPPTAGKFQPWEWDVAPLEGAREGLGGGVLCKDRGSP